MQVDVVLEDKHDWNTQMEIVTRRRKRQMKRERARERERNRERKKEKMNYDKMLIYQLATAKNDVDFIYYK